MRTWSQSEILANAVQNLVSTQKESQCIALYIRFEILCGLNEKEGKVGHM